jgi:hypothetical protein
MSQDNEPYCNHDAIAVTNGMCECGEQVGPIAVTLALTGLPDACPHCGAPAPDGEWGHRRSRQAAARHLRPVLHGHHPGSRGRGAVTQAVGGACTVLRRPKVSSSNLGEPRR